MAKQESGMSTIRAQNQRTDATNFLQSRGAGIRKSRLRYTEVQCTEVTSELRAGNQPRAIYKKVSNTERLPKRGAACKFIYLNTLGDPEVTDEAIHVKRHKGPERLGKPSFMPASGAIRG